MVCSSSGCYCQIVPPYLLNKLANSANPVVRQAAENSIKVTNILSAARIQQVARTPKTSYANTLSFNFGLGGGAQVNPEVEIQIFDANYTNNIPGLPIANPDNSHDPAILEALKYNRIAREFFNAAFERSSIDGQGMTLSNTVHYRKNYDNAFWNGNQMVYGDGDGVTFNRFTKSLDVIGHELSHGIVQYTAQLEYHGQPGALNESFADIFGSLVKQWHSHQTVNQADWLIGAELIIPGGDIDGKALRSLMQPGSAYVGDPQPAHMENFYNGDNDNGGVHYNSGIPNRAFYLAATAFGGHAWEKAGRIWYTALTDRLSSDSDFAACANATIRVANDKYGRDAARVVQDAWMQVGVPSAEPLV